MKRLTMIILTMCMTCLVACSNKGSKYSWEAGVISGPKGVMEVSSFSGQAASTNVAGFDVSVYICDNIEDCPHNELGVQVESMTEYKKAKYYVGYLGTQMWMFVKNDDGTYTECHLSMPISNDISKDTVASMVYERLVNLSLSNSINEISVNGVLTFNPQDWDFSMSAEAIVIQNSVTITKDDGSITATSTETLSNGATAGKYIEDKYVYYIYEGLVIKAINGLNINSYVTFKEIK